MENVDKAFDIFKQSLDEAHIPSITTNKSFHEDTEALYELAFDVYHLTKEADQNLGEGTPVEPFEAADMVLSLANQLYDIIKKEIDDNKDIGKDNLLRGLAERSVAVIGKMKRYKMSNVEENEE